jgi:hypothetical protein
MEKNQGGDLAKIDQLEVEALSDEDLEAVGGGLVAAEATDHDSCSCSCCASGATQHTS